MRIPASKLLDHVKIGASLALRTSDFKCANSACDYTEIVRLAIRGDIEGIATPAGKVKMLRLLPDDEREAIPVVEKPERGGSTAFAHTNMGVYLEKVHAMENHGGIDTKVVIGRIYQHCSVRLSA